MPNLKVLSVVTALVTATSFSGNAADAESNVQELSLRDCIDLALQHNLSLQIERRNPLQSKYGISGARGAYYDPTFRLSGSTRSSVNGIRLDNEGRPVGQNESDTDAFSAGISGTLPGIGTGYSIDSNLGRTFNTSGAFSATNAFGGSSITITQPLLRNLMIDGGRRSIALSKNNLKISEMVLKRQVMNIVTQVERAYYNLVFAYDNVAVQQMSLELAERSLAETKKRFEVGTVAELETKQTESQVAGRRAGLLSARRNLELQQNVLKRLISDNYLAVHSVVLRPTEPLDAPMKVFDVQLSWDRALTERPDLIQQRIAVENNGINLKFDRNQLLPQLDLQGSYGLNGTSLDGRYQGVVSSVNQRQLPRWNVGVVLTVPLGNRVARSNYRSRQAEEEQLLLTLKNLEQSVMVEIDDAIKQAASEFDQVNATYEAREYAEAALEAEQKRLENGKSTSFVVLSLQNDLTSARSAWIRAKADYNNALAELSFREASTLQRHNISWDSEISDD